MASLLTFHLLGLYPGKSLLRMLDNMSLISILDSPIDDPVSNPFSLYTEVYHSQQLLEHQYYSHG